MDKMVVVVDGGHFDEVDDDGNGGGGYCSSSSTSSNDDNEDEDCGLETGSSTSPTISNTSNADGDFSDNSGDDDLLAKKETKAVNMSKFLVIFVLMLAAVSVSYMSYHLTKQSEDNDFEGDIDTFSDEIVEVAEAHTRKILAMAKGLSTAYTAHALLSNSNNGNNNGTTNSTANANWPNIYLPFFEIRAQEGRDHSNIRLMGFAPLVKFNEKESWEEYVATTTSTMMQDSNNGNETIPRRPIRSVDVDTGGDVVEVDYEDKEFYVPLWQIDPSPNFKEDDSKSSLINSDLSSYKPIKSIIEKVLTTKEPALSEILDLEFLYKHTTAEKIDNEEEEEEEAEGGDDDDNDDDDPHALLVYPVFENFDNRQQNDDHDDGDDASDDHDEDHHRSLAEADEDHGPMIKGFIFAIFPWEIIFKNDELIRGMYVVLTDTCGNGGSEKSQLQQQKQKQFTYYIDEKKVTLLSKSDDVHESRFDYLGTHTEFELEEEGEEEEEEDDERIRFLLEESHEEDNEEEGGCEYHFDIYPSTELYENYATNKPIIYAIIVVAIFIGTALVFILYEYLVQRRQNVVMKTATNANAIVTNMFPKEIQQRMMQDAEDRKAYYGKKSTTRNNKSSSNNNPFLASAAKDQLENFLDDDKQGQLSKQQQQVNPFATKPIAELYPAATLMMADICGFTSWSSAREPSQVFTCLETIYHAFDLAASKYNVFKVETVGDCYVAVAGVPKGDARHFISMAKYARACLRLFKKLVRGLEVSLGPDTSALDVRFGLHSGPVTAGVLRGDKARFQLFGEVVNTAAQIESSSMPGRIQISSETAELLKKGGLGTWLEQREETVFVRGKGDVQTYWLTNKVRAAGSVASVNSAGMDWAPAMGGLKGLGMNSKSDRLVEWNTEQLVRLLKEIEARRRLIASSSKRNKKKRKKDKKNGLNGILSTAEKGTNPLDEWKEIIELPNDIITGTLSTEDIEMNPLVVAEVRDYVKTIANMYNDNMFHSFEHASHVANSVNKLLSRIVTHENDDTVHDPTYGITSDPLTRFACVFSSLIHDVDHPGVPNPQLIKENPKLASLYNGKSVAEQYSIDLSWSLLMEETYVNFRAAIFTTQAELKRFRDLVVNSVLATDIMDKELKNLRNGRWDKAFKEEDNMDDQIMEGQSSYDDDDVVKNRKATIVIEHLIQASDVAHTMQHWDVYLTWNKRFFRECYQAYLDGRADKDPSVGWYKGEIGFYDFYIIPLAKKLADCGVFGVSSFEYLNYAQKNREQWVKEGEAVVEEMLSEF